MSEQSISRKLTTILAADVAGYTRHVRVDEESTLNTLGEYREIIENFVNRHEGRVFNTGGDSILAEFGSAVEAVRCAVSCQEEIRNRNTELAEDRKLEFRIGISIGDVVVRDGDLLGDGVNVAARLEGLADAGGVCISGGVFEQVKHKLSLSFEDMGEQTVKNIDEPISAYRLVSADSPTWKDPRAATGMPVAGSRRLPAAMVAVVVAFTVGVLAYWRPWTTDIDPVTTKQEETKVSIRPMIAVLPFDDYGDDPSTGRLAKGLTEDIITDLARFPEFGVIARNSTERYAGEAVDARSVGEALGVGYVLEGSIQRLGKQLRITAQLIETKNGSHLWSSRWDRPAEEFFAVQTEISETIANKLGGGAGVIQQTGRAEARRKQPDNLGAYELYLLGSEKLEKITKTDVEEAIRLLKLAVERDPELARAWVELFHAHNLSKFYGADGDAAEAAAVAAAERAVSLDPSDAEAHAVLGSALASRGEFTRAKASFDTALRMAPNAFEILAFYASWAGTLGDLELGAELAERAIELNPDYPMWAAGSFSWAFFQVGQYERVLRLLERQTPDNYPNFRWAIKAGSLAALGRTEEATAAVRQALERYPNLTIEGIISDQGMSKTERQRFIETMRLAGFPPCASPDKRVNFIEEGRLDECN